jgi:hypothetical protein
MICVRCGDEFSGNDLLFPEGNGLYCPKEHRAWLKKFKVYQTAFLELIRRQAP